MNPGTLVSGGLTNAVPPTETARLAGYYSAQPTKIQAPAGRIGNSPDSPFSSIQRVQLSFEGQNAIKNTPFARNYVLKRRMYCSSGATWAANTGDDALNAKVQEYLAEVFPTMGMNCSMLDAYGRVGDCFLPERGDAALRIYRDENGIKLLEITGDRIGELFAYNQGSTTVRNITLANGAVLVGEFQYFQGLYFRGPEVVAYKIYDRQGDMIYTNPKNYPASEIIFFKDDLAGGVRGVSIFATALLTISGKYQILNATVQTMQQQSKIAAIGSNNAGGPTDLSYETRTGSDGQVEYLETYADGAVVKWQFNGDSYHVLKAEHPSEAFIGGMKYLDWDAALSVGFPGEFLFSPAESGGAPSRFSFSIAGREIERIRNEVHRPRLRKIAYLAIMQGVQKGALPPKKEITRGDFSFGVLPSADAFRDSQSDIKEDRAGLTTKNAITIANSGTTYPEILRERVTEVVMLKKAVAEANKQLAAAGLPADVTTNDIAQNSDNPQMQPAPGEEPEKEEPAALSAFMGDVMLASLPADTQAEIERIAPGSRLRKFGMTVSELLPKADPHNMDAARKRIRYCRNGACAEEVYANSEKHVLMMNDRVVDGHHYLAKAEKGRVTKSLPVIDIIPALSVVA